MAVFGLLPELHHVRIARLVRPIVLGRPPNPLGVTLIESDQPPRLARDEDGHYADRKDRLPFQHGSFPLGQLPYRAVDRLACAEDLLPAPKPVILYAETLQ